MSEDFVSKNSSWSLSKRVKAWTETYEGLGWVCLWLNESLSYWKVNFVERNKVKEAFLPLDCRAFGCVEFRNKMDIWNKPEEKNSLKKKSMSKANVLLIVEDNKINALV